MYFTLLIIPIFLVCDLITYLQNIPKSLKLRQVFGLKISNIYFCLKWSTMLRNQCILLILNKKLDNIFPETLFSNLKDN